MTYKYLNLKFSFLLEKPKNKRRKIHNFKRTSATLFVKGFNAAAADREICDEEAMSARIAQIWFKRFSQGDKSLKDRARRSNHPSTSTRKLSPEFGMSQTTVYQHLKHLGFRNQRCREVPHELSSLQAQQVLTSAKSC